MNDHKEVRMKLLIITPIVSSTFSGMTKAALESRFRFQAELDFVTLETGPDCIEGFADEVWAGPGVLDIIREKESLYDGFFINCFGDVAVDAARELTVKPVLGAGEASYFLASMLGVPFSIITIGSNARNKNGYHFRGLGSCRFVSTVGIEEGVLALNDDLSVTAKHITDAARKEMEDRGTEAIVLGCTGMIDVATMIRDALHCPVIEPSSAGIAMLESMVRLGISHAQGGKYTPVTTE